jgi:hypothetical protein
LRKIEFWLPDKIHDLGLKQARQHETDVSALYAGLLSESLLADTGAGRNAESAEPSSEDGLNPEGFQPRMVTGFVRENEHWMLTLEEIKPDLFKVVGEGRSGQWEDARFDVSRAFVGFPKRSIEYAQRVVDEALKLPRVIAQRFKKNGISFKPKFLFIEALLQRKSGIRVSLYGEPTDFAGPPGALRPGRGSYSRIVVTSDLDLEGLLPLVRQAYEHRFASQGDSDAINSI